MSTFAPGVRRLAVCTLFGLVISAQAWAQIPSLGVTTFAPAQYGVNSAVAYDDKHNVYLHVYESSRQVLGRFIDANGNLLGAAFPVGTYRSTFAGRPKVAYSRNDAGVDMFLVLYVSDKNKTDKGANIFGQRVQYTGSGTTGGTLVGSHIFISPNSSNGSLVQFPSDVIYNPLTHRFAAAYQSGPSNYEVMVRQFAADGTAVAAEVNVSSGPGHQGDARMAHDWEANRYFVIYMGDNPANANQIGVFGRILNGSTAAAVSSNFVLDLGFRIEVGATYLPERNGFLGSWMNPAPDRNVVARFVASTHTSGAPPDAQHAVLSTPGVQEGAATLDYDYISRKVLVSAMREPKNIAGSLLNGNGLPVTGVFNLATPIATSGAFNPFARVAESGRVAVSFITDYAKAQFERFQLTPASTPGPACCDGSDPEPPPDPPPGGGGGGGGSLGVTVHTDNPLVNQQVQPPFILRGWAIDDRSTSGPGISVLQVWAASRTSSALYHLGYATVGAESRPDVAAAHGANFLNSGYNVSLAHVPPGQYTLTLHPYSTYANAYDYNKSKYVNITVAGGVITKIDTPTWPQVVGNHGVGMTISGWAVDMSKPTGTGVDQVQVWGVNASTGTGTFLGTATYGLPRNDVGVSLGDFRFNPSGFSRTNTTSLASGTYYILVISHSIGASSWNVHVLSAVIIQ